MVSIMLTGDRIRDARALLRWGQKQLAETAGVSIETVKRLEKTVRPTSAYTGTATSWAAALEAAGGIFTNRDAPGVKLRRQE